MTLGKFGTRGSGMLVGLITLGIALAWAEPPAEELSQIPSSYAPAQDLDYQFRYLIDRIEGNLEDPAKFDRYAKRVVKDANTIAVLALVLGQHDQTNSLQGRSAAVVKAATQLATQATNHADAHKAFGVLVASQKTPEGAAVRWQAIGDIEQLMLQVPQLNTSLKSNVKPSRFASSQDKAAGLAATLAAIAQVAMFDDTYCADDTDHADWVELCVSMRDAARDVHEAIRQGDPDAAQAALKPLTRSCDDCHEQFKD